jgi:SIR2-like domain
VWGARTGAIRDALFGHQQYLIKLHGDAHDETDRVLTRTDYARFYGGSTDQDFDLAAPLAAVLTRVFESATLLFLGCSLTVDRTMRLLQYIAQRSNVTPSHYAIVERPQNEADLQKRRRALLDHNIQPLWYGAGQHEAVEIFVKALIDSTGSQVL